MQMSDNGLFSINKLGAKSRKGKEYIWDPRTSTLTVPAEAAGVTIPQIATTGWQYRTWDFYGHCLTGISGEYSGLNVMHIGYTYDAGLSDTELSWAIAAPLSFAFVVAVLIGLYCCGCFRNCSCNCCDRDTVDYDFEQKVRRMRTSVDSSFEPEHNDPDIVESGSVKARNRSGTLNSKDRYGGTTANISPNDARGYFKKAVNRFN